MVNTQRQQLRLATMDRSRQSMAPQQRTLSLTEELEKLEQSITLTLQGRPCQEYPANTTDGSRDRPQFQSSASYRHYQCSSNSTAVW